MADGGGEARQIWRLIGLNEGGGGLYTYVVLAGRGARFVLQSGSTLAQLRLSHARILWYLYRRLWRSWRWAV